MERVGGVIKDWKKWLKYSDHNKFMPMERRMFKESILALEQKKKLIEFLNERIESNQKRLNWQNKHLNESFSQQIADGIEQRIIDYQEIESIFGKKESGV